MLKEYDKTAIITASGQEVSYSQLLQRIFLYSQSLPVATAAEADGPVEERKKVLIFSENREGFIYAFYAAWQNRLIAVPVDAGSTPQDLAYILNDCRPVAIWTNPKRADVVRQAMREAGTEIPLLDIGEQERTPLPTDTPKADISYTSEQTAVIIYTSGTTGSPKGVMLSFGNLIANIDSVTDEVPIFRIDRRALILLPLHHVLPLNGSMLAPLRSGGGVAIAGSMTGQGIISALQRGRCAIVIGVPRLWQTLYMGMKKKIDASPLTRALFWVSRAIGWAPFSRFIFAKIQRLMGGNLQVCVNGGAALDPAIWHGLKALGIEIVDGYGMTECAPMITFSHPGDLRPGCVGLPFKDSHVVIKQGEICVKGANVMQGYLGRPDETADVFDDEGFLHTGDLGRLDETNHLYITGRKKEIIVLSNGKNINPAEVEYHLEAYSEMVAEAAIVQDADMLRAIIVPQKAWAEGKTTADMELELRRQVLEPYNQTVASYKRLTSLFVYEGELPRTRIGKLQRYKLAGLILRGSHVQEKTASLVEPSFPEYRIIKQYIRSEKKCVVNPDDNIETDLGFDSLDKVGMQGFIEQTFGMQLTADQIGTFRNITEMAEYVADYKTRIEPAETDWHTLLNEDTGHLSLPGTWPTGPLIIKTLGAGARAYFSLHTTGREHIPASGPVIFAPNHQCLLDGLFVMYTMPQAMIRHTYFYAKAEHVYKQQWRRLVASRHNIIVMDQADLKQSIMQLGEVLRRGLNVIIFPEGTRTPDGRLGEFKKTFAILAVEMHVPVVPVAITGAHEAWPKGKRLPSAKPVSVQFLPPITAREGQTYEELTDEVRSAIAAAL